MPLLFDVSPEEPSRKGASRSRRPGGDETPKLDEFVPPVIAPVPPPAALGTIDHTYACPDRRCGAECHDILSEEDGLWRLECCFCGTMHWVKVIRGHLKPKAEEFRFRDGICQGMTIDQAAATTNGIDYIEWAAESHKRDAVRAACKTWLDARRAAP